MKNLYSFIYSLRLFFDSSEKHCYHPSTLVLESILCFIICFFITKYFLLQNIIFNDYYAIIIAKLFFNVKSFS